MSQTGRSSTWHQWVASHTLIGLMRILTGTNIHWAGCQPGPTQRIFFANHTSNLDGLVIWAALPPDIRIKTRPVAAHDYWSGSFRRYLADQVFHAVLIERQHVTVSNNPMRHIGEALGAGYSLIIFPEGGRQSGADIGSFKSGLYHMAKEYPQIELIPVYIDNMNRVLPKGEILPVPILSSVTFGAPMQLLAGEEKRLFLERTRNAITVMRSDHASAH